MRKVLMILGLMITAVPVYAADEPFFGTPAAAAILQNPVGITQGVKSATATLAPSLEEFYDIHHSEWFTGSTVSLWNFSSKQVPIASVRAGFAADTKVIGELKVDAQGITKRYIIPAVPQNVKDVLTAGVLEDAWGIVGKYGHTALFGGYDVQHHDNSDKMGGFIYGFSIGGSF